MISKDYVAFKTQAEAEAFLSGIRYVDDGVHSGHGVETKGGEFFAVVEIDEGDEEEEEAES